MIEDPEKRLGTTDQILGETPFLRRFAFRLVRRDADADDLVQETLLRAYRARKSFERGTSMRAWLATILRRLFLTESIKSARRRTHADTDLGEPLAGVLAASPARSGPGRAAEGDQARDAALEQVDDRIHRAFRRLPDTFREPFILFALDGLSYAEIAAQLTIPIGTVMSRIHRARHRLREQGLSTTTSDVR